jgi:5-methylcytosine-specific restriction endonuclease McrA
MAKETRTYADRREYFLQAVNKRRQKIKMMAIELKGGKCQLCGYNKYQGGLDFHHIDPSTKNFGIASQGHSRSWARVQEELAKCILVCANCHREVGAGLVNIEHLLVRSSKV